VRPAIGIVLVIVPARSGCHSRKGRDGGYCGKTTGSFQIEKRNAGRCETVDALRSSIYENETVYIGGYCLGGHGQRECIFE
jgi:hypothetical protein